MVHFVFQSSCWTQLTDQEGFAVHLSYYSGAKPTQFATWQGTRISYAILEAFKQVQDSRDIAFYYAGSLRASSMMLLKGQEIESATLRNDYASA